MIPTTTTPLFSANQKRLLLFAAILLSIVLISIILKQLASILKPFLIAVFLVNILEPGVSFLSSKKIPRALCYLIMILIVFLCLYFLGVLVYANLEGFTKNSLAYENKLNTLFGGMLKRFGIIDSTSAFKLRDFSFLKWLPTGSLSAFFSRSLGSFFDLLGNSTIVAFFMLFLIAETHLFQTRIIKAYGNEKANSILKIIQNVSASVRKYILIKLFISLGTAVLATAIMAFFQLDFYAFFGFLVFILNFIPYIGSIIATVLPVLFAFLQYDSAWTAVWLMIALIVIQNVMGSILEPQIAGRRLNLSPLIVLISVMFWGWLWGSIGMLLSIPILATIRIIFENFEATKTLAVMMSEM